MTKLELRALYMEANTRARTKPQKSEEAVWFSQLGHGDIRDLRDAIDRHFDKSSWMPKESELKPLMELARRERTASQIQKEYFQQQVCPKCRGVVGMLRPMGEQGRTWCIPCQSYRKIVPEDMNLPGAQWQAICAELERLYRIWVRNGSKYEESVPDVDRDDFKMEDWTERSGAR